MNIGLTHSPQCTVYYSNITDVSSSMSTQKMLDSLETKKYELNNICYVVLVLVCFYCELNYINEFLLCVGCLSLCNRRPFTQFEQTDPVCTTLLRCAVVHAAGDDLSYTMKHCARCALAYDIRICILVTYLTPEVNWLLCCLSLLRVTNRPALPVSLALSLALLCFRCFCTSREGARQLPLLPV